VPVAAGPVRVVEQTEPVRELRPVKAVVERRKQRVVVRPRARPRVRVKVVKKRRPAAVTGVRVLCARQFPHDVRLREACVAVLS